MTVKLILVASAMLAAAPASAQSLPAEEQSANDLVCQLSGECSDQIEATRDKPQSRGFKMARKAVQAPAVRTATSSAATGAGSSPKAVSETPRSAAIMAKPGRSRTIDATARRAVAGRADLRVSFVTGSAELTEGGRLEADKFLTALANPALSAKKFRIEGHTDPVGSRDFNLALSKRRAQAVVDYLAEKGADRTRFAVQGYGFDQPLAGLAPSAGANRRVEIVVIR